MSDEPRLKPIIEDLLFAVAVAILIAFGWLLNDLWFERILR